MRILFALLVLTVLVIPAGAQDFAAGLDAYDRGDFDAALKEWRPLAEQGDARAQFNLGVIHFNGQGVPHDPITAATWYRAAADQGYGPALANLAFLYESGQGLLQNYIEAYKWSTLALQHGATSNEARDRLAAKMTADQIAEANRAAAAWKPLVVVSAPELPRDSDEPAVTAVPTREQVREAQILFNELGYAAGPADGIAGERTRAAIRDYQKQNGLPVTGIVTVDLIDQLARRKPVDQPAGGQDQQEQIAAREPENPRTEARRPPATGGQPVTAQDCDRLAAHPADARLPDGVVGVAFENIDADRAVAACELALAINADNPRYQVQFARSLHKADRLEEAVTYYQQAGLQGHPLAQKSLGFAYASGLGVTQDYAKAAEWHHLAAEQGDSDAQHNLGFLYAGGRGVTQDFVQAHMWYNIAAAHSSAGAAEKRDILASRMTEAQLAEAIRRAAGWFDLHPESLARSQ